MISRSINLTSKKLIFLVIILIVRNALDTSVSDINAGQGLGFKM